MGQMAAAPIIAEQCDQRRLARSVGGNPTGVIVRNPVTWITREEETNPVKLIDKAIFWMVSESPGRNESKPTGGPDKYTSEAESSVPGRRQNEPSKSDRCDSSLRRGGRDSTVTRTRQATGETVLAPSRNRRSKVGRITAQSGKSVEGETVEAGPVVAMKRGNARGARGPCCTQLLHQHGRQGCQ